MTRKTASPPVSAGTVRIGTIAAIPKVLRQLGFSPAGVFAEIGFDASLLDDPDNVIPYASRNQLIQHCVSTTRCPYFGFLLGQHVGPSSLGLVGFLVQQSPDVAVALNTLVRYAYLHVSGAEIYLEQESDRAFMGYSINQPRVKAHDQIEDGAVAIIFNTLVTLCGPRWSPSSVHFAHRKPADSRIFQHFFKAPLHFDAERCGLYFSTNWLQQRLLAADPELHRFLQKQVDQLESRYSDNFAAQVQRVLHSALLSQHATADEIAALFSIHPRTLNRRLHDCGTSFKELADQGRFEIARQLLRDSSMKLSQIAATLDYADASAFSRAFRRWSGTTPARWRVEH